MSVGKFSTNQRVGYAKLIFVVANAWITITPKGSQPTTKMKTQ